MNNDPMQPIESTDITFRLQTFVTGDEHLWRWAGSDGSIWKNMVFNTSQDAIAAYPMKFTSDLTLIPLDKAKGYVIPIIQERKIDE